MINLLGSSDARIDYGDIAAVAGASFLSIALTVRLTASPADRRLFHQWGGDPNATQCFILSTTDTDEVAFIVNNGGTYFGRKTVGLDMVNGGLYRIAAKLSWSGGGGEIWVNGVSQTITTVIGNSNIGTTLNSSSAVQIGHETDETQDGLDADYGEAALWTSYLSSWMCEAYGKGYAPSFHQDGLIFYAPLHNTSHLRDVKGGVAGTNTAGTNADHPSMMYPRRPTSGKWATMGGFSPGFDSGFGS